MSFDWQGNFPYSAPREIQAQALEALASNWNETDVFVISAPTAFGKTALARTLMNALYGVSTITPTNLLVDQFRAEFPDTPTLSRLDSYQCSEWRRPCPITRAKLRNFCKGGVCPASRELSTAKYRRGPGIYNYHTYLAHKLYRDVLVVDEAHNLIPHIRNRLALRIWRHDYKYPLNAYTNEALLDWVRTLSPTRQSSRKISLLKEALTYECPQYIANRVTREFNGKGTERGEPEMRDCIELLPVDISDAPPLFWPREVRKIVLLSATIGPKDIEQLGLTGRGRRVKYIDCKSPISEGNRPIVPLNLVSVNRGNMEQAAQLMGREINKIAEYHTGEKGVIHATYAMAELLRLHLEGDRYMFHTRSDKADRYAEFRASDPRDGRILVASGMYEGIDLPEDLGRWQVIAKIPWQSLANPAVRHLSALDPELYLWETVKTTIQACGRICRTPADFGVTYVLDSSFQRLLTEGGYMCPDWFLDAIQLPEEGET